MTIGALMRVPAFAFAAAVPVCAQIAPALPSGVPELEIVSVRTGLSGMHVRLRQCVAGVPVLGTYAAMHVGAHGVVTTGAARLLSGELLAEARACASTLPPGACLYASRGGRGVRGVYERWIVSLAPPESTRLLVDACSGAIVAAEDRALAFDGAGRVFDPNPVVTLGDTTLRDGDNARDAVPEAAYRTIVLRDLDPPADGEYRLAGPYVTTEGTPFRARDAAGQFFFLRDDPRFEEVMVYYHIDRIQRALRALGFTDICARPVQCYVDSQPPGIPFTSDQARYLPDGTGTGVIAFGTGGVDAAEDADVIAHEYGHAILDDQVIGFGESREAVALAEGFADFLSAAVNAEASADRGDACIGEWKAEGTCLRTIDNRKRYPDDMTFGDRYADGAIWAATLWELVGAIGRDAALALALEANFFLAPDATFIEAGEALLQAQDAIFGGAHAAAVHTVLVGRGILRPPLALERFSVRDEEPDLAIPDDAPFGVESELVFSAEERIESAWSLQLYLDIAHPYPPDLSVTLVAPSGKEAALPAPGGVPVILGAESGDAFAPLLGENACGTWRVRIVDRVYRETGVLRAWGLHVLNVRRGEINLDGTVNLADAIALLGHLFTNGALACRTRGDCNDDGGVDIADAIYLLGYLFAGGAPPPPPFESPGADPTPDDLACPAGR